MADTDPEPNVLVHADDGSGNAIGRPLYSGGYAGADAFKRQNGGGVIISEAASAAIVAAIEQSENTDGG